MADTKEGIIARKILGSLQSREEYHEEEGYLITRDELRLVAVFVRPQPARRISDVLEEVLLLPREN